MKKAIIGLAVLFLMVFLSGCAKNDHPLRSSEKVLGTNDKLNWTFHRVVEDKAGIGYRFPGYLIGIEKSKREVIGIDDPIDAKLKYNNLSGKNKKKIIDRLNDTKRTFISHIVGYHLSNRIVPRIKADFHYNIYEKIKNDPAVAKEAYDLSWKAMGNLAEELRRRIEEEAYTHVFIFAMGWNTDQQEAVRNYNSLFNNLIELAEEKRKGQPFKPLFIGFSWPSRWKVPLLSYFNKANDADEVGAVWINVLINQSLLPLKREGRPRIVVVGHSFGARAITRAVFSKALLFDADTRSDKRSDLVIGLQGAFSINRFIDGEGGEGSPYSNFADAAKQFVFTWSNSDTANPIANFVTGADHIGGKYGYHVAQTASNRDIFLTLKLNEDGNFIDDAPLANPASRMLLVDASNVIKYSTYTKGGMSHSDIYKPEIAKFIWYLIDAYAP